MKNKISLSFLLAFVLMLCVLMTSCAMLYLANDQDNPELEANDTLLSQKEHGTEEDNVQTEDSAVEEIQIAVNPIEPEASFSEDETEPKTETEESASESGFEVHFIDVGQADAALVICDGKTMLIDGGNKSDSQIMYTYLKKHDVKYLDYVIGTHAHEDHIGGISGALSFADCGTVYCPVTDYDSEAFSDFAKQVEKKDSRIQIPCVGTTFDIGSALAAVLSCNAAEDTNESSIVLKITYGNTSFLFTGDAEREAEQFILDSGADISATVLKVGHHGSETSTSYPFLREVMPKYAVISVGKDNSYGHPTEETLSRLNDAGAEVYRTDLSGDIVCRSDGENVTFEFPLKGEGSPEISEAPDEEIFTESVDGSDGGPTYILNINSNKFHLPTCGSAEDISEKNRKEYFGTREDAVKDGYSPCGRCNP